MNVTKKTQKVKDTITKSPLAPFCKGGKKDRLDNILVQKGLAPGIEKARALIMAGSVMVDGQGGVKAGKAVSVESVIELKYSLPYVGRGGLKLAGALDVFKFSPEGLVAVDVGSSTGGFTDCLLQRGARRVYAVDVGKGVMDFKLRSDARVCLLEERNIRHLDPAEIPEKADIAVIDVSFISLEKVLPRVKELLKEGSRVFALVKPQFEVAKGEVGKGGIVKDPEKQREVVERIRAFAEGLGFEFIGQTESPITGAKGNREFWLFLGL